MQSPACPEVWTLLSVAQRRSVKQMLAGKDLDSMQGLTLFSLMFCFRVRTYLHASRGKVEIFNYLVDGPKQTEVRDTSCIDGGSISLHAWHVS
jgi:hypothetical protein